MGPRLPTVVLVLVMVSVTFAAPTANVSADCEEELNNLREDLNATKRELEQVREERDDYAQRLEDSTTIMIIVLILLVGSYVVFYINTRRAKIAYLEFQRKAGVNPDGTKQRPRKRRRG